MLYFPINNFSHVGTISYLHGLNPVLCMFDNHDNCQRVKKFWIHSRPNILLCLILVHTSCQQKTLAISVSLWDRWESGIRVSWGRVWLLLLSIQSFLSLPVSSGRNILWTTTAHYMRDVTHYFYSDLIWCIISCCVDVLGSEDHKRAAQPLTIKEK